MKTIIFTDGSSRGNPGPGGWGTILISDGYVTELGGREDMSTNNRMELKSVIEGLRNAPAGAQIVINADSEYVIKGITLWVDGWVRKGWKTAAKKAVLNQDLWKELLAVREGKNIEWKTVLGHAGVVGNERADEIATSFADNEPTELFSGTLDTYSLNIVG